MNRSAHVVRSALLYAAGFLLLPGLAVAQMDHAQHGHDAMMTADVTIGQPGPAAAVTRTIAIEMGDNFFSEETISVKAGETVRFVITNKGELLHEFAINTPAGHGAHQQKMAMMFDHGMLTATGINQSMAHMDHSAMGMSNMDHTDGNAVLVEPGKSGELIWTFAKEGTLEFACTIPGHYEAGMVGKIGIGK